MAFLNNIFNKNKNKDISTDRHNDDNRINLNMKKEEEAKIKLNLRKEKLTVCLKKKNIDGIKAAVGVALDKSGSTTYLYSSGKIQETLERILPLALKFDDDGELDVWAFSKESIRLAPVTENDFYNYIPNSFFKECSCGGGTNYAPVINDIVKKYIQEDKINYPVYILFFTDGENSDKEASRKAIIEAAKHNIFFQFVGIGDERFVFLKELDNLKERVVDNANFFEINDLSCIDDTQLYERLMQEFPKWIDEAKRINIIRE